MPTTGLNQETRVYQKKITIPTYELLPDDRNPIFDKSLDPYPYSMQNHVSKERVEKEYDAVIIENEYLKLTVLPSLGGRLYSAVDKRIDQEFLYRNTVIRPRMIGTRGAWFSGGIEFNFPISHSPTTSDRVNCQTQTYEDGSASVIFGSIEQMSFMNWKVELRLYPGKAYIEQNVSLYNPTPRENKYYFWTNTAIEYNKSLQLIYPFDWCVNFEKNYLKWPYNKNIDCRNPREIPSAFDTFGKLMINNFFGMYNHEKRYGLVHYANRKKIKGAKFFTWGNDQAAETWNRCLTDNDSQYIEIQSGPFETQGVYKFMRPHQELNWSEYWYPVSGMDGFKHAEKEVVMNFDKTGNGIRFSLLANEDLNGSQLVLKIGGKRYRKEIDLTPDRVVVVNFEVEEDFQLNEITIDLYSKSKHIVNIGERQETTDEYPDPNVYEDSRIGIGILNEETYKTLKQGQWRESLGLTAEAFDYYLKNLETHPSCTITLNRLGQLYLKSMQYRKAEECFRNVLAYDNRNGQARFYLAAASKAQGDIRRARRLFMDIAADSEYYQASLTELIKIDLLFGYYQEAQMLCELLDAGSSYEVFLESIAYRKDGFRERAGQIMSRLSDADEFILAENYLLQLSGEAKERLVSFTAGDEKSLLPVALDYWEMGLSADAEAILQLIANPSLKTKIALGLVKKVAGNDDEAILQTLKNESLDYLFLKEPILLQTLAELQDKDDSGKADYLLGTFYYAVSRKDDALEQLLRAYEKGLRYTVLLHNIGYIYLHYKKDSAEAEAFFAEDVNVNYGVNEDSLVQLDQIYQNVGRLEKRMALIPYMENAANQSLVLIPLVNILKECGEEEKAWGLLENEEFDNWEGQDASGRCYRDFILHMVKKELGRGSNAAARRWMDRVRKYPERLNYGEGAGVYLSEIHYYSGIIYSGAGDESLAVEEFRKGVQELFKEPGHLPENIRRFSMKCAEELQKRELIS